MKAGTWWFLPLLSACSGGGSEDGLDDLDENSRPRAVFTIHLEQPASGTLTCPYAGATYQLGTVDHPLVRKVDGAEVECSANTEAADSTFVAKIIGTETQTHLPASVSISTELDVVQFSAPMAGSFFAYPGSPCTFPLESIVGSSISAQFECPLLAETADTTKGCSGSGSVDFENCEL